MVLDRRLRDRLKARPHYGPKQKPARAHPASWVADVTVAAGEAAVGCHVRRPARGLDWAVWALRVVLRRAAEVGEHGEDTPVVVWADGEVELGED